MKNLKITLIKSTCKRLAKHKACISGLGLRRMHHSVIHEDTACLRGKINQLSYMLKVEEC
jgi:large subunit ribosomal protein L30